MRRETTRIRTICALVACVAFSQAAVADCEEDSTISISAEVTNVVTEKSENSDRYIGVKDSGDGNPCHVDTIWLENLDVPNGCKAGADLIATGTLDFGGFGDESNLTNVGSISCK